MNCKSCGAKVAKDDRVCHNCGFDLVQFSKLKKVVIEDDPNVSENKKTDIIDTPVLTFIFGILAIISSLYFVASLPNIVILYLLLVILFNFLTFYLGSKPAKVKYKPFLNIGKGLAYFSIAFIVLKVVFDILGHLFFN